MSRRREPRVEINVEVTVWGIDRYGKPFVQHARTLNATRSGARLLGIDCVRVGETVGIQHGEEKSRCQVVWVGREDTPRAGQVGVQCLEDKPIFTPKRNGRGTEFDLEKVAGAATTLESARPRYPEKRDNIPSRRRFPRYHCSGGVELRHPESGHPIWGNLNDLCLAGCYVETVSTLPAGSQAMFQLRFQDLTVRGRAVVRTSHHAVGMGLAFQHLAPEDQQNLEFLISSLAGKRELRTPEERNMAPSPAPRMGPPVPPPQAPQRLQTTSPVQPAQAAPAQPALPKQPAQVTPVQPSAPMTTATTAATQPARTVAAAPAPVKAAPAPHSAELKGGANPSALIMRALTELSELEQGLLQSKVDARLIGEFHDALEHTRQTAWNVQRFMDLNSSGGDAFAVMPQLEAERMRMLAKLARNATMDIDSSGTDNFVHDVAELSKTVEQLQRRLTKMLTNTNGTLARTP